MMKKEPDYPNNLNINYYSKPININHNSSFKMNEIENKNTPK
jgi:hypothetical protein